MGGEEAGDREMSSEIAVVVQVKVVWPETKLGEEDLEGKGRFEGFLALKFDST